MRNFIKILILILAGINAFAQQTNSADSLYIIQDSVLIKTRDGASIYSIVIRKKADTAPLPAILFFTTYYQGAGDASFAKIFADRGYVGIVAYCRGIRTNLNDYFPYENDGNDAYDVIDWISKQLWSNGEVGMFGGSYLGYVQWAAAKGLHPALKTIVPQVAVMPGFDTPMENNIPFPGILSWPYESIYHYKVPPDLNERWYKTGSSFRSMDSLAGMLNPMFQKWLQHPDFDSYWRSMLPTEEDYSKINIPILTTTGYYDGAQIGNMEYFKLHQKYNPSADDYLVIGPYDHFGGQRKADTVLMGYKIDEAANISMRQLAYEWLDYILKKGKKPEILKDRINYEVMGANDWKYVPSLEKMNNGMLTFYLSSNKIGDRYILAARKSDELSAINQKVDFKDRTTENNYFTPFIINDSLDVSNGLVFETEPFVNDFDLCGTFSGQLSVEINKKDMDVSIAFYEQTPDGKYFYLTRYLGRASYANDKSKRQLLTPNRKETFPLGDIRIVCRKISKGSRIAIILNVNKHPYDVINYGTGKDVNDETIKDANEPLKIKWFDDSFIRIPVWRE